MDLATSTTPWAPRVLSILRIVAALALLAHGTQKVLGFPPGRHPPLLSLFGAAGLIELIGGALLVAGFLTRPVAFVVAGEMAFAYFIAHAPKGFIPAANGGDAAVLFCFVFLYIFFAGPGPWSIDALMRPTDSRV